MLLRDMKCFRLEMTEIGSILEENKLEKLSLFIKTIAPAVFQLGTCWCID